MSQLVELKAEIGDIATRLDLTTGPGLAALQRHYIDPTVAALEQVARKVFGPNKRPFKTKTYAATVAAKVAAGPDGTQIIFQLGPKGYWVYGQYGTKPHLIPKLAPPAGRQLAKGLKAAGAAHPTRQPIKHPGAKGRHAIDQAWKAIHAHRTEQITTAIDEVWTNG